MRCLILLALAISAQAGEPVPATNIKLDAMLTGPKWPINKMAEITKFNFDTGTGEEMVGISFTAIDLPFWKALDSVSTVSGWVITVADSGKTIVVKPGRPLIASSDGPFRVYVTGVTAKFDALNGQTYYDVALMIHWEPRFPVIRIDTTPAITTAADDRGSKLTSVLAKTKSPIGDSYCYAATVRIDGLTRDSKKIATLNGEFTVTASPKMLAFAFDDLGRIPQEKTIDNVSVTLTKFKDAKGRLDAEVKLLYPESHPVFESFESWTDNNTIRLLSADRTKSYSPENFSLNSQGRRATAEYHFTSLPPGDRMGWTLTYGTPAPLTEYAVKFSLKEIPLP